MLCIIEAMKLMNEIESDVDGVIAKIYPQNAQPVEFGEPLFAIRPDYASRLERPDVQEDPDRQPRRDRAAHHPGLPRAGHRDGGGLLDGRPRQPARHLRRRGGLHRPAALAAQSYLNISAIISAAEITGADAIHPGYGFLAENAHFAEVCRSAGSTLIGPRPEVIRLMGDKAKARQTAVAAGVPVLPGSQEPLADAEEAKRLAAEIGYPVILKAAAGGGGRGMRIVRAASTSSTASSPPPRDEAEKAFGDGSIYLEKYLVEPRHIEFQVFGDHHGNVIHLGERECSIQRRHQKLIEESPSPALTPELRERMGEAAVRAVRRASATRTPAPSSSCSTATAASTSWR